MSDNNERDEFGIFDDDDNDLIINNDSKKEFIDRESLVESKPKRTLDSIIKPKKIEVKQEVKQEIIKPIIEEISKQEEIIETFVEEEPETNNIFICEDIEEEVEKEVEESLELEKNTDNQILSTKEFIINFDYKEESENELNLNNSTETLLTDEFIEGLEDIEIKEEKIQKNVSIKKPIGFQENIQEEYVLNSEENLEENIESTKQKNKIKKEKKPLFGKSKIKEDKIETTTENPKKKGLGFKMIIFIILIGILSGLIFLNRQNIFTNFYEYTSKLPLLQKIVKKEPVKETEKNVSTDTSKEKNTDTKPVEQQTQTNSDEQTIKPTDQKVENKLPEISGEGVLKSFDKVSGNVILSSNSQENLYRIKPDNIGVISTFEVLTVGSFINFTYNDEDNEKYIAKIVNIQQLSPENTQQTTSGEQTTQTTQNTTQTTTQPVSDDFTKAFGDKYSKDLAEINKRKLEEAKKETKLEDTNTKITTEYNVTLTSSVPTWFRFGWRPNDETKVVAKRENVTLELKTPNGTLINQSNISKFGKYWIDEKGIINYAIKNASMGKWTLLVTKNKDEYLGEISLPVIPLSGYIEVEKFAAVPVDGKLLVIWKARGVKDDALNVEIFAEQGTTKQLIYSANTVDTGIHLLDKAEIVTAAKLTPGTYNIRIKMTDIDMKEVNGEKKLTASYLVDDYVVKNVIIK